jgi:hypothetical protein
VRAGEIVSPASSQMIFLFWLPFTELPLHHVATLALYIKPVCHWLRASSFCDPTGPLHPSGRLGGDLQTSETDFFSDLAYRVLFRFVCNELLRSCFFSFISSDSLVQIRWFRFVSGICLFIFFCYADCSDFSDLSDWFVRSDFSDLFVCLFLHINFFRFVSSDSFVQICFFMLVCWYLIVQICLFVFYGSDLFVQILLFRFVFVQICLFRLGFCLIYFFGHNSIAR